MYRLSWLFRDEVHRGEFLRYLVWRYRVHTLLLAGCEFLERMVPRLKQEFPEIAIVKNEAAQCASTSASA